MNTEYGIQNTEEKPEPCCEASCSCPMPHVPCPSSTPSALRNPQSSRKRLLIIRSISFQQLDTNLRPLRERFRDHELHLLTHEHDVALAEKYRDLRGVHVYPRRNAFSPWHDAGTVSREHWDTVIIPVTNLTGSGFINVLLFSLRIPARKRYLCNLLSETRPVSTISILTSALLQGISMILAAAASLVTAPFALLLLTLGLFAGKLKSHPFPYDPVPARPSGEERKR